MNQNPRTKYVQYTISSYYDFIKSHINSIENDNIKFKKKANFLDIQGYLDQGIDNAKTTIQKEVSFIESYCTLQNWKNITDVNLCNDIEEKYYEMGMTSLVIFPFISHLLNDNKKKKANINLRIFVKSGYLNLELRSTKKLTRVQKEHLSQALQFHSHFTNEPLIINENKKTFELSIPIIV